MDINKNEKEKSREKIITLSDLWGVFLNRLLIMILASVIGTTGFLVIKAITFSPQYKSTATLYILRQNEKENNSEIRDDFSLALNVVNDCTYLLKSHAVLDEVIDELGLEMSYSTLSNNVSTHNPDNTRILEVSVVSNSPELSKKIVDSVCQIGSEKIKEAMGFNQVNLYENGTINGSPSNRTATMLYVLLALGIFVVMYLIFVIQFIADDRIRTEEDIKSYLGLSVLGDIPTAYASQKGKYGYYGKSKYKAYGKNENTVSEE